MKPILDTYPIFEVNQVLTRKHLNDVFGYLDEQTRLTRSRLIGIGIVCGLKVRLEGSTIHLAKGCGVTSEGYLIIEPDDIDLVSYRPYTMPSELDYPPFKNATNSAFPMWELFPAGEPNTTPLNSPTTFLEDKGVVLFLELNKQALRNCSPNNCDDKGSEVTVTVRRLLMQQQDLDSILAAANQLGTDLTADDLDAALSAKLALPDVKVSRFDVPNTGPVTSADVFAAFLKVFTGPKLSAAMGSALTGAYDAFKPIVDTDYPTDPFAGFSASYGFLDSAPTTAAQVRFLQYYVELFEDLVHAYDEFRWKGLDLVCACCPSEDLFPRHLMLGLLHQNLVSDPGKYRHTFLPSPAVSSCTEESKALLGLFHRLVELATRFTNAPSLPTANDKANIDPQIRITPSVLGDTTLDKKAIPYYYRQDGTPPLYRLWSSEKTQRKRANQNLSYRYDEYTPSAPAFVSTPLRYDLEPYNFLRVEGHLGKHYQKVLKSLLSLKQKFRLAFDVIALRTGGYDSTQAVDVDSESAQFQDLEAVYDSLREELLSTLAAGAMDLYSVPVVGGDAPSGTPTLPLLKKYAPHYRYPAASVGGFYEAHMDRFGSMPYIDIDQTLLSSPSLVGEVLKVYCGLFLGLDGPPAVNFPHVVSIFYFSKLAEILPQRLDALAYADFENKYQDLLTLVRYFRSEAAAQIPADLVSFAPKAQLIEQFDQVLYSCKVEAIRSVYDEFKKRIKELKKMQFLASFLQKHPGIQHKGGVPTDGTLIIVYHATPSKPATPEGPLVLDSLPGSDIPLLETPIGGLASASVGPARARRINDALSRIANNTLISRDPDVGFLIDTLTGRIPDTFGDFAPTPLADDAEAIIKAAAAQLDEGTVIADFFLPYKLSAGLPGIEFVLPKASPSLQAQLAGVTGQDRLAPVAVEVKGGTAPYELSIDNSPYEPLKATVMLLAGSHVLRARDSEGTETNERTVSIPEPITFGAPEFQCDAGKFIGHLPIEGGTPPYTVNGTTIVGQVFTTPTIESGGEVDVEVFDSTGATAKTILTHTCPSPCELPCGGAAVRRGYRFWWPEADPSRPYKMLDLETLSFIVESQPGKMVDLTPNVLSLVKSMNPNTMTAGAIQNLVNGINKVIQSEPALNLDNTHWFMLRYESRGAGRLGVLWIEHFDCLAFEIRIRSAFARPERLEVLEATYVPEGTKLRGDDQEALVPQFEGERIDKCQEGAPETKICEKTPQIKLTLQADVVDSTGIFSVKATPASEPLVFFWEVPAASPPFGNGETFKTEIPTATDAPILVVVTAYTKQGCTVTVSDTFGRSG